MPDCHPVVSQAASCRPDRSPARCGRCVRRTRPFAIDAWVVLPDRIHTVWPRTWTKSTSIRSGTALSRHRRTGHTPRSNRASHAGFIRTTGLEKRRRTWRPANPAAEDIRRNTPRGYSGLRGLGVKIGAAPLRPVSLFYSYSHRGISARPNRNWSEPHVRVDYFGLRVAWVLD